MRHHQRYNAKAELVNDMATALVKRANQLGATPATPAHVALQAPITRQYNEYVRVCKFLNVPAKDIAYELFMCGVEVAS